MFYSLLCKNNTDEMRTLVQLFNYSISAGHCHTGALILRKNEDLKRAQDIWRDRIKKLDEDARRKKRYKLLIN